jgi:hypothetical protein
MLGDTSSLNMHMFFLKTQVPSMMLLPVLKKFSPLVMLTLFAGLMMGCPAKKEKPQPQPAVSRKPKKTAEDKEAEDVVRVLAGYYQMAGTVDNAYQNTQVCLNKTVDINEIKKCIDREYQRAFSLQQKIQGQGLPAAESACGKQAEAALKNVINGLTPYIHSVSAALTANQKTLTFPLTRQAVTPYCASKASTPQACTWLPPPPPTAQYATLANVACIATLFECGGGGVCDMHGVAGHLGISQFAANNKTSAELKVKPSGKVIPPLRK